MRILLVGISVRAMVESAVRSGYAVIGLDAFGDQDLRAMTEAYGLPRDFGFSYSPTSLLQASQQIDFDAVVYTSNLENYPETIELFALDHPVIGNLPHSVRAVRNWQYLFRRLAQTGLAIPKTIFTLNGSAPDHSHRWLLKPILSGGGRGICFLRNRSVESGKSMLQEYVPGRAGSAAFVGNGREAILLGVTEQLLGMKPFGARGFRYCGSILPLPEMLHPEKGLMILAQARRIAECLVREYSLSGVNGFDFILEGDKIWLVEVNPRYSASMELIEKAYNLPVFKLHMESVVSGRLPEFNLESRFENGVFFGKSILFCEKDCVLQEPLDNGSSVLRDIPSPGEQLRLGNPVCTVLTEQSTYDGTLKALISQAENLRKQLYG